MNHNAIPEEVGGEYQGASTHDPLSPVYLTCTAQSGGHVVAPVLTNCQIGGPINFNIRLNSTDTENIIPSQALPVHLAIPQPAPKNTMTNKEQIERCKSELKSYLRGIFTHVLEGLEKQRKDSKLLNQIYTELYITEGGSGEVNTEHEVRQIEKATRMAAGQETPIQCNDIFQPIPGQDRPTRTVITRGVAGIGKTFSVHKFILDWVEGKANQDFELIFPLEFRKLNLVRKDHSLIELLEEFLKGSEISVFNKMLFVFDGLDECRHPLDFQNNESCCDVTKSISVDALLTNLIKGNLLPSAHLWITSRPAASSQIPSECVDLVTDVRGFNNPQKEEYFRRRISDENLANRIITHVKSSRSLYIMCYVPVFCSMIATVLEKKLRNACSEELPKTLTQMYIQFLIWHEKNVRLFGRRESDVWLIKEHILSLGKLAFNQLQKGNLIFYEDDLRENGIDVEQASVFSGVYTEIFSEELALCQRKVFCFVHASIQEFLAALYVFLTFSNNNVNLLAKRPSFSRLIRDSSAVRFYKAAVDQAVQSENGHWDLFVRFLLGLSLESNHTHLGGLLTQRKTSPQTRREVLNHIKENIKARSTPERCINLFHCLNELNDHSLVEEIQHYLSSGSMPREDLSHAQWSALVFALLTSEEDLNVFDLKKYSSSEEGLLRLLPVVKASQVALLNGCKLTEKCCEVLASALSSTQLRELDLSENGLQDRGVQLLSVGLETPHCRLEKLRLRSCNLTEKSCEILGPILSSSSSHLRELDLSDNDLQNSGIMLISAGLGSIHCKLDLLKLSLCRVTEEGCAFLASALNSNPSHLRELDLSYNHPGESGVRLLSAVVEEPCCRLEKLRLKDCAEIRINPGPQRYVCELTLDPNTAHIDLSLSEENRKVRRWTTKHPYPDHPERFDFCRQVLCQERLTGRRYWEIELSIKAAIGVAYRRICRRGEGRECRLGQNDSSWSINYSNGIYTACHNAKTTPIISSSDSKRVGVYLDWPAGTLSFYGVSSGTLTHLHTFHANFTEPVYPGFTLTWVDATVTLCQVE